MYGLTPDDGRKDCLKHVECHSKTKKNIDKLVHLVGSTIDISQNIHVRSGLS